MRGNLTNIWYGGEDTQLGRIFQDFLRTPGNHPYLEMWLRVATGEPLAFLYDIWTEAKKKPEEAYRFMTLFMEQYNVAVGVDVAGEASGEELFYNDLTELCNAVDSWISTGQLSAQETGFAEQAANFYRNNGGINAGALNIIRGWYELLQVIQDRKRVARCTAADCNKLLIFAPSADRYADLLSGTVDGYHSMECKLAHSEGAQDQQVLLNQLPGNTELESAVGSITQETPDVQQDTPETS